MIRIALTTLLFVVLTLSAQSQIAFQSFEGLPSDTWGFTSSATPFNTGSDIWDVVASLSTLNPTDGSQFWGAQDVECPSNGGAPSATLTFATINVSSYTGVTLEFDYETIGFDTGDDVNYTVVLDGVPQPVVNLVNGAVGGVSTGIMTEIIPIPGGTNTVGFILEVDQNGGSDYSGFDRFLLNGTLTSSNTITTTTVATTPFNVECNTTTTDAGTVDFTSTGTFTGGNIYTAQLSDASGSFASPINIGTLVSTANAGTISITIPETMDSGSGYLIRVISSAPAVTGTSSAAFTINQNDPCLPSLPATGLIINEWSNGPSGSQEYYEFVVAGECGETVDIRGYILDDNNATFTNPVDYDGTASGIAPGHFRFTTAAQWATIPVGSVIVIYNDDDPNGDLPADDPTDANNDSLYVVPHTSTLFERCTTLPTSTDPDSVYTPCTYSTAPLTGWGALSLRNSGDAIQVRLPNGDYYHGVSYGGSEMTGGPDNLKLFTGSGSGQGGWFNNGDPFDVSNWSSGAVAGNQTPGTANNAANAAWLLLMRDSTTSNCPITVLPVEIGNFKGINAPEGNVLYWYTVSERDASHFIVERSTDGKKWTEVGLINAVGNSTEINEYQLIDVSFASDMNYYRLIQYDNDGTKTKHTHIVSIDNRQLPDVELIGIYNLLGQKVDASFKGVQIRLYSDGTTQRVYK